MAVNHERRLRNLEAKRPRGRAGKFHLVLLRPGANRDAEVAKLTDRQPGDEMFVVQFVRPADRAAAAVH